MERGQAPSRATIRQGTAEIGRDFADRKPPSVPPGMSPPLAAHVMSLVS
jgi:hypothetical protein